MFSITLAALGHLDRGRFVQARIDDWRRRIARIRASAAGLSAAMILVMVLQPVDMVARV